MNNKIETRLILISLIAGILLSCIYLLTAFSYYQENPTQLIRILGYVSVLMIALGYHSYVFMQVRKGNKVTFGYFLLISFLYYAVLNYISVLASGILLYLALKQYRLSKIKKKK